MSLLTGEETSTGGGRTKKTRECQEGRGPANDSKSSQTKATEKEATQTDKEDLIYYNRIDDNKDDADDNENNLLGSHHVLIKMNEFISPSNSMLATVLFLTGLIEKLVRLHSPLASSCGPALE